VRTEEFIPVAPCSFGKRQSESRKLDEGCLFDFPASDHWLWSH